MIRIKAYINKKPVKIGNGIFAYGNIKTEVPVIKIKNDSRPGEMPRYRALVYKPEINAPYNFEWPPGQVWINFTKAANKHLKLPVLKSGEVIDV